MAVGQSGRIDVTVMPQSVGKVRLFWREDYNVEENYSTITITNIQGYLWHRSGWTYTSVKMAVDNTVFYGASGRKWCFSAQSDTTFRNVVLESDLSTEFAAGEANPTSHKIYHNDDGTKTVTLTFTLSDCWCSSAGFDGTDNQVVTQTVTLTPIPRASSLSAENGTLGVAQNLTVTKHASNYTHTITYTCGSASGTICTKSSATTVSATLPLSLAAQNTTGENVVVVFRLQTYSGDTAVGSEVTKTVYMYIPLSVTPTATIAVSDPMGYATTFGGYVQGKSKIRVVTTPTLAYGSPIASCVVTADWSTYNGTDITTIAVRSSGTLTVQSKVVDKRGRGYTATKDITVLPYTSPVISKLTVHRCDSDGTENSAGSYAKVTYSFAITSLSSKNAKTIKLQYKKSSASSYTTVSLTSAYSATDGTYIFAADDGASYDVVLSVTDSFSTATRSTSVSTAAVIMHFNSEGNGIAFGKISEKKEAVETGWDIYSKGQLVRAKRCRVGQSGSTTTNPWYRFASLNAADLSTSVHVDNRISFKVNYGYGRAACFGILNVSVRFGSDSTVESTKFVIESDTGLVADRFVLAYSGGAVELWVNIPLQYTYVHFDVISESSRNNWSNNWVLYDISSAGHAASVTSGYTQVIAAKNSSASPKNLLDNSNFRNPVNQRGQSSYTGIEYTIDRWRTWSAGEITVADGYITTGDVALWQYFEPGVHLISDSTVYTAALRTTGGTLYVYSGTFADGFGDWGDTIYCGTEDGWYYFRIEEGMTAKISWVALYEGRYSADTLPLYQPKSYSEELAECYRYYRRFNGYSAHPGYKSTTPYGFINLTVPMRTTPTATIASSNNYFYGASTRYGVGSISAVTSYSSIVRISFDDSTATTECPDYVGFTCLLSNLELSADL